ncbi:unnamed protein product [Pylaiella littoralis]
MNRAVSRAMWRDCFPWVTVLLAVGVTAASSASRDHNPDEHSLVNFEHTAGSFLELAQERFEARNGRPATSEEETWTLEGLQLVRVPKAGSSEISLIARRLGGCTPRGPCCNWPGDPPGSCPAKGLMCPAVVGCTGHHMGDKKLAELKDANVFSMTSVRGVVDRMVSGFFYAAPHSPGCAHKEVVHYKGCFTTMTTSPAFQNVMAKMFTGQYAYEGATTLCLDKQQGSEGGGECSVDLEAAIQGACNLNFVAMCEIWESSVLLLFETLPWLGPTSDFFPIHAADSVVAEEPRLKVHENGDGAAVVQRQNTGARHEEGIKHITPELREAASHANSVDEALHEFLSAKFCDRLKEAGLLEEPLVARELATYEVLDRRCNDYTWVNNTLERYKPLTPEDCRLYRPFVRP